MLPFCQNLSSLAETFLMILTCLPVKPTSIGDHQGILVSFETTASRCAQLLTSFPRLYIYIYEKRFIY